MKRHIICKTSELPAGSRKIVTVNGRSIGVFNVKGQYYALRNLCPHQMAELCRGTVTGYCEPGDVGEFNWARQGEIIRCPWHGWEFDIKTGKSIFNPHKVKTRSYEVKVEALAEAEADTAHAADGIRQTTVASAAAGCGSPECGAEHNHADASAGIDAEGVETFAVEVESDRVVLYA